MRNTKHLNARDAGYVMVCTFSDSPAFVVGKKYITERGSIFIDEDVSCPDINGGYSLNYQRYRYYGVEGCKVYAKFIMLKDNKGRYVKHDTQGRHTIKSRRNGKTDPRRFRRYVRQLMKTPMSPFERHVFGRLVRRGL